MICLKKALNFNGHLTISKSTYTKLSVDVINPNVVRLEYAVRGPIVQRAQEIENSLKKVISLYVTRNPGGEKKL